MSGVRDEPSAGDDRSTLSGVDGDESRRPAALWARRVATAVLVLFVAVAATGLLGVHSRTVTASAGGFTLTVDYAGVARAGLDVPLRVTVESDQPWDDELTVSISREYLAIFETQGFHPDASGSTSQGADLWLTFDTPPVGGPFVLDYDAYIQPASQRGNPATIAVVVDDQPVVSVDFSTFLFP